VPLRSAFRVGEAPRLQRSSARWRVRPARRRLAPFRSLDICLQGGRRNRPHRPRI